VVLDYGFGNIRSAERALARAGAEVTVSSDAGRGRKADGLVVPGVGAFAACMAGLDRVRGPALVRERAAAGAPTLGICVGMQVLFEYGEERGRVAEGVGLWPGTVRRLRAPVLPHMGWNTVDLAEGSRLFAGLDPETRFYFVHSYAATTPTAGAVSWATHGERFVAAVEAGPVCGTQFHPEKSGDAGAALLENWLGLLR
jgi:glutamine amidotransferase